MNCSGTVTAVEFCFTSSPNSSANEVFTLQIYEQTNHSIITRVKSVPINSTRRCNTTKCCGIMRLQENDQFNLSQKDFYIGMVSGEFHNLPGLYSEEHPSLASKSYRVTALPTGSDVELIDKDLYNQTLRLMWLHISKSFANFISCLIMQLIGNE